MTDQSFIRSVDFNGLKLRYLKGPDPLFVFNDIAAALGYTSRDGLMFRVSKSDIERIQGTSRMMNAIKWSKLCDLLLITSNQKPEQSRSLRDFITKNILPDAKRSEPERGERRKYQLRDKSLVEQFGGGIAGWRNGNCVTTSIVIADRANRHHRDVMKEVFDHQSEIERFGKVLFDQEPFITDNGIEQHKIAILNEKQAAVLLTCMHKRRFKRDLSRAFYEALQKGCPDALAGRLPVPDVPLMNAPASTSPSIESHKTPWNKGKLVGQKLPLKLKEIWAIRTRLQLAKQTRELALFNLAIDSKLRGCDLVELHVRDVTQGGQVSSRATIMQRKPHRSVQFELTEQTRDAVAAWISEAQLKPEQFLFPSRLHKSPHISTRQYAKIVDQWVTSIGLDRNAYGTHTMRRTKATLIYRRTKNLRAVQTLMGHAKLESTVRYLGIEVDDALDIQPVDTPVSAIVDHFEPALKRPLGASRVMPALPSAAPVAPALAVGVVEPFISSDNGLTMSSLEIAELTGKQHKHILRDIRNMLNEIGKRSAHFGADLLDSYGRSQPGFLLPKRETLILVSGYSIAMRARIIDRWQELERRAIQAIGQPQFAIPQTLHEALQLASNLEKERSVAVEKLAVSDEKLAVSNAKLAIAEPKAEALDVIANTEGLLGLQETGRVLDQPPNLFVKWLRDEVGGWIHKRSRLSKNMPFADKAQNGYLVVKSAPVPDYRNGGERMESQTMVTPKGLARIALLLKEIPPSYTIDKPIPAPKPRGLVRQAINRATKPVMPEMFREMQAGQQEPLF